MVNSFTHKFHGSNPQKNAHIAREARFLLRRIIAISDRVAGCSRARSPYGWNGRQAVTGESLPGSEATFRKTPILPRRVRGDSSHVPTVDPGLRIEQPLPRRRLRAAKTYLEFSRRVGSLVGSRGCRNYITCTTFSTARSTSSSGVPPSSPINCR